MNRGKTYSALEARQLDPGVRTISLCAKPRGRLRFDERLVPNRDTLPQSRTRSRHRGKRNNSGYALPLALQAARRVLPVMPQRSRHGPCWVSSANTKVTSTARCASPQNGSPLASISIRQSSKRSRSTLKSRMRTLQVHGGAMRVYSYQLTARGSTCEAHGSNMQQRSREIPSGCRRRACLEDLAPAAMDQLFVRICSPPNLAACHRGPSAWRQGTDSPWRLHCEWGEIHRGKEPQLLSYGVEDGRRVAEERWECKLKSSLRSSGAPLRLVAQPTGRDGRVAVTARAGEPGTGASQHGWRGPELCSQASEIAADRTPSHGADIWEHAFGMYGRLAKPLRPILTRKDIAKGMGCNFEMIAVRDIFRGTLLQTARKQHALRKPKGFVAREAGSQFSSPCSASNFIRGRPNALRTPLPYVWVTLAGSQNQRGELCLCQHHRERCEVRFRGLRLAPALPQLSETEGGRVRSVEEEMRHA